MKVALIHDWLLNLGGAERVIIALHKIFPEAPIYTLVYSKEFTKKYLPNAKIVPSILQKIPFILKIYPYLPFLMPLAAEAFRFDSYDLVISSNIAFSKGVILKPHTRHICYCHSPTRWLWDWSSEYNQEFKKRGPLKYVGVTLFQHFARIWDKAASARVDYFIANSKNVAQRIRKYYRQETTVIYPPVNINHETWNMNHDQSDPRFKVQDSRVSSDYFLIVSQLFKHKNIDIAIRAFAKLQWPLIIVGRGPEKTSLKSLTKRLDAKNIFFTGFVNDQELQTLYQNSIAFVMPQEEDFGITPVESMSHGKPILALRRGGAKESIIEGVTGEFFDDPNPIVLADGARRIYEKIKTGYYSPLVLKKHAEKFSEERFKKQILDFIESKI
ncbi:MAG: glycosyltransferase [Parcubacteria group bacterium]|nr:glycosyltransferase [Parcubacteria group bacterium]